MRMGEALGNNCDNLSTHVGVASAVSSAASVITDPPESWSIFKNGALKYAASN
jgi:hypothetical protein